MKSCLDRPGRSSEPAAEHRLSSTLKSVCCGSGVAKAARVLGKARIEGKEA
jgi:hypothetical protein